MILAGSAAFGQSAVSAEGLRVEYLVDPLGIDVQQPRLSWLLAAGPRGQKQSAYQIVVASSLGEPAEGRGRSLGFEKVNSDDIAQVAYAGRAADLRPAVLLEGARLGRARPRFAMERAGARGPWVCCAIPTGMAA